MVGEKSFFFQCITQLCKGYGNVIMINVIMINLENINQEKCQLPCPLFKKTCPCTILPPPFFNFSDPPLRGRLLKFTSPPLEKKGVGTMVDHLRYHLLNEKGIKQSINDYRSQNFSSNFQNQVWFQEILEKFHLFYLIPMRKVRH